MRRVASDSDDVPPEVVRSGPLTIMWRSGLDDHVVELAGEADIGCAHTIETVLRDVAVTRPRRVEIDLARLAFLDSTGVQMLVRGHGRLVEVGAEVSVRGAQRGVRRVLELIGVADRLGLRD